MKEKENLRETWTLAPRIETCPLLPSDLQMSTDEKDYPIHSQIQRQKPQAPWTRRNLPKEEMELPFVFMQAYHNPGKTQEK
jgi:hypothetical protein